MLYGTDSEQRACVGKPVTEDPEAAVNHSPGGQ